MKILSFAGSTSKHSINKSLVTYVSQLFKKDDINLIDLNDLDIPLFNVDIEEAHGMPEDVTRLSNLIKEADLVILSLAEHNGAYSAAFKNVFDWLSRVDGTNGWHHSRILLMATSPGGRGGKSVLELARDRFPRNDGNVIATFSLPSFEQNFDLQKGITNPEFKKEIEGIVTAIQTKEL
jgi:NAD(P)H-dependent FMN reductase